MVGNVILPFQNIPTNRYIGILHQYTGIITHNLYRRHSPRNVTSAVDHCRVTFHTTYTAVWNSGPTTMHGHVTSNNRVSHV
jgi:hypothetical protein